MQKNTCRVCGAVYEACKQRSTGAFRWKDVACSPACGQAYLQRVLEGRAPGGKEPKPGEQEQ